MIQEAGTAPGRWCGQTFCGGGGFGAGGWEGSTLRGVGDAKDGRRPESSRVKIRLVLKKNNIDFLKLRRINYNKKIDSHWISEIYPFKLQGIITTIVTSFITFVVMIARNFGARPVKRYGRISLQ